MGKRNHVGQKLWLPKRTGKKRSDFRSGLVRHLNLQISSYFSPSAWGWGFPGVQPWELKHLQAASFSPIPRSTRTDSPAWLFPWCAVLVSSALVQDWGRSRPSSPRPCPPTPGLQSTHIRWLPALDLCCFLLWCYFTAPGTMRLCLLHANSKSKCVRASVLIWQWDKSWPQFSLVIAKSVIRAEKSGSFMRHYDL